MTSGGRVDVQPPAISGSPTTNMEGFILKIRIVESHGQARFTTACLRTRRRGDDSYSDLGRTMKRRHFAQNALIVDELAD